MHSLNISQLHYLLLLLIKQNPIIEPQSISADHQYSSSSNRSTKRRSKFSIRLSLNPIHHRSNNTTNNTIQSNRQFLHSLASQISINSLTELGLSSKSINLALDLMVLRCKSTGMIIKRPITAVTAPAPIVLDIRSKGCKRRRINTESDSTADTASVISTKRNRIRVRRLIGNNNNNDNSIPIKRIIPGTVDYSSIDYNEFDRYFTRLTDSAVDWE